MIRQFEYLAALAKERHFSRAAATCHVTQSTLSAGIKQLEDNLGVAIVARNQRFVGFTAEGERVLFWAQHLLGDYSALRQELGPQKGRLIGRVTIGVIPTAEPVATLLTADLVTRHPAVQATIKSLSSLEIQRGIFDFTLDAGLTYLDDPPPKSVLSVPIFKEGYLLVTSKKGPFSKRKTLTWREVAGLPLCLLTPDMKNRRIIDEQFRAAHVEAQASVETNSLNSLWSHLHAGPWSGIVPNTFLPLLKNETKLVGIPLVEPEASSLVGLIAAKRDPISPVVKAVLKIAEALDVRGGCAPCSFVRGKTG